MKEEVYYGYVSKHAKLVKLLSSTILNHRA
jgi:hypothetical protein